MKVYIVVYDAAFQMENEVEKAVLGAFTTLTAARACFTDKFLKPFFQQNDMRTYFAFDALHASSEEEWQDILSTFMETATIETVALDQCK